MSTHHFINCIVLSPRKVQDEVQQSIPIMLKTINHVEKFYWECIIALRKSFINFITVFFSAMGVHAQSYFGLVVIFACLVLHVMNEPFATKRLNFLETAALSVSFLTLYFGLMFFSGWMNEGEAVFLSVIHCNDESFLYIMVI